MDSPLILVRCQLFKFARCQPNHHSFLCVDGRMLLEVFVGVFPMARAECHWSSAPPSRLVPIESSSLDPARDAA